MTPEELRDMDGKLVKIASHPTVSAEDARYAMTCALLLIAEVRRLQNHAPIHDGGMTVSELIEQLKRMPGEAQVVLPYVYMDQPGLAVPLVLGPDNPHFPGRVVLDSGDNAEVRDSDIQN